RDLPQNAGHLVLSIPCGLFLVLDRGERCVVARHVQQEPHALSPSVSTRDGMHRTDVAPMRSCHSTPPGSVTPSAKRVGGGRKIPTASTNTPSGVNRSMRSRVVFVYQPSVRTELSPSAW